MAKLSPDFKVIHAKSQIHEMGCGITVASPQGCDAHQSAATTVRRYDDKTDQNL